MFFRSAREKQTTIPCPVCAKALYSTIGSDKPRRASEAISAQIASVILNEKPRTERGYKISMQS